MRNRANRSLNRRRGGTGDRGISLEVAGEISVNRVIWAGGEVLSVSGGVVGDKIRG